MGLLQRLSRVIRAKLNSIISSSENPIEQLDYAYEELKDEQKKVADSIVKVTTQKKKLRIRAENLEDEIEEHNEKARLATEEGREDLARRTLRKKQNKMNQLDDLNEQIQQIDSTLTDLEDKKHELDSKIEDFKTKKEVQKAKYQSAKTQKNVAEATTGIGDGLSLDEAVQDLEDEIEEKQARAEALDEMSEDESETLEEQLEDVTTEKQVEDELASLRQEVSVEKEDSEF